MTSTTNGAEQLVAGSATNSAATEYAIPIFEVWWSIPASMSAALYEKYTNNEDAGYTWDWGDARSGSWTPDEEETSINRYVIDLHAWEQRT